MLALAKKTDAERMLAANALGRVLAEDVRAHEDLPAFDASTMDGYAVRARDVRANVAMRVASESRAGKAAPDLEPNVACRIFTGAPMPHGADAVIMQEEAERERDSVRFRVAVSAGAFVRKRGEDLRAKDVALAVGTRVGPAELAMLASLDLENVNVSRAPRVTILPTGDELRAVGSREKSPSSIPESNAVAIAAMASRASATVTRSAAVSDDRDRVRAAIEEALDACDVLVTIGGVSVGDHDVVRDALEASGVTLDFWRIALKPGKPLAVGKRRDAIVLGLPGNPVSAMITFALFGVPLLRAMQSDMRALPRTSHGRLAASIDRKAGRLELARARIDERGDVALLAQQASGAIASLCRADVLACIPRDAERLEAGSTIDIYALEELGLR